MLQHTPVHTNILEIDAQSADAERISINWTLNVSSCKTVYVVQEVLIAVAKYFFAIRISYVTKCGIPLLLVDCGQFFFFISIPCPAKFYQILFITFILEGQKYEFLVLVHKAQTFQTMMQSFLPHIYCVHGDQGGLHLHCELYYF